MIFAFAQVTIYQETATTF